MARPSKLTDKQWEQIRTRRLNGETVRALAAEFGISPSTLNDKVSVQTEQIKKVANQIVDAQQALNAMPISEQISVQQYAQKLLAIGNALSDAAIAGAHTAKQVTEALRSRNAGLTDSQLLEDDNLKSSMASSMVANTASKLGMDMLNLANKPNQTAIQINNNALQVKTINDFYSNT
jgi:hypothetical protein